MIPGVDRRWLRVALAVAGTGAVLCAAGLLLDPRRLAFAWLTAVFFGVGTVAGALGLLLLGLLTVERWLTDLARPLLLAAAVIPVAGLLLLPVAPVLGAIYPWVPPVEAGSALEIELTLRKRGYLNVPFFLIRGTLYLAVWSALAGLLTLRATGGGGPVAGLLRHPKRLGAVGFAAFLATATFAGFDWIKSLEPAWFSSAFGLYVVAGWLVAGAALAAVAAYLLGRGDPGAPPAPHGRGAPAEPAASSVVEPARGATAPVTATRPAVGNLLLGLLVVWAYLAFCQYLILWIGNIPAEIRWLQQRTYGGWGVLAAILVLGGFLLPFLLLLSRNVRRSRAAVAAIAGWVLVIRYLETYWLVLPAYGVTRGAPHWLDVAALGVVAGVLTAAALVIGARTALRPPAPPPVSAAVPEPGA
jgi:hypothetical protein